MEGQLDLHQIQNRLWEKRKVLSTRIKAEKEKVDANIVANPDRSDLAHEYSYRERQLSILEQLEGQLEEVNRAIQRVEEGSYGQCTQCGNFILPERLEALPHAELCINCQRQNAQKE